MQMAKRQKRGGRCATADGRKSRTRDRRHKGWRRRKVIRSSDNVLKVNIWRQSRSWSPSCLKPTASGASPVWGHDSSTSFQKARHRIASHRSRAVTVLVLWKGIFIANQSAILPPMMSLIEKLRHKKEPFKIISRFFQLQTDWEFHAEPHGTKCIIILKQTFLW